MNILDDIVAHKRLDVDRNKAATSQVELEAEIAGLPPARPWSEALRQPGRTTLIAEVKRASPSRGILNTDFDPVQQAVLYAQNGAAAISCLTEEHFFLSDPADLARIKDAVSIPVLRKDFLFDAWQIGESRVMGADAVLLIATSLEAALLGTMLEETERLGLGHLVEVHDEADLERALATPAQVIGINNRDLNTFEVDLETTRRLAAIVRKERPDAVIIAESGLFTPDDMRTVRSWGCDAALIGEALMKADDVAAKVAALTQA